MSYGFFRPQPQLPQIHYRSRAPRPPAIIAGLYVPGTVYSVAGATTATVLAMAEDHYGVGTLDALAARIDPDGPRTMEDFCQAWWGKPYADCIHEILLLDRMLQFVRQSSRNQAPGDGTNFRLYYYGGDLLDSFLDSSSRRRWIGADYLLSAMDSVDLGTNIARFASLPLRNHSTNEFKNAETDAYGIVRTADALGAGFRSMLGNISTPTVASTYVTPNQVDHPNTVYWPIAASPHTGDEGYWMFCWLVLTPTPGSAFIDHEPQDTHVLNIGVFGTVDNTGKMDVGAGGNFFVSETLDDSTHRYIYGREFDPGFGDFTGGGYYANMATDTFYTHVARVPNATAPHLTDHVGTTYTNYEWWTGTTWSTDRSQSAAMIDSGGTRVRAWQGVFKLATDSYVAVAQDPFEDKMRIHWSATPQGPWWNYRNVPIAVCGADKIGTNIGRHRDFVKIYGDFPARTDHAMTVGTNLAWTTGGATYTKDNKHLTEADTPYMIEAPTTFGDHAASPPSAVHRMRPLLVR